MKLAIELNATDSKQLRSIAEDMGVPVEELAAAAIADLIRANSADFEGAASRILEKNRELYKRLS